MRIRAISKILIASLSIIAVFLPSYLAADGCYFSKHAAATSADQRAVVIRDGLETTMVLSTAYTGETEEFSWIIPVPVPPKRRDIREADHSLFEELEKITAPKVWVETDSGCFPVGTPVLTANGMMEIQHIRPGMLIQTYDNLGSVWGTALVTRHQAYRYAGDLVTIRTGDTEVTATGNHLFLARPPADVEIEKFTWIPARDLKPDFSLISKYAGTINITSVESRTAREEIYHLEVEAPHTYAVLASGIVVHNGDKESVGSVSAGQVTVYGVVRLKSYEVSILGGVGGAPIIEWLIDSQYAIPRDAEPVLEAYAEEHWVFVAVKLYPEPRRYNNEFL